MRTLKLIALSLLWAVLAACSGSKNADRAQPTPPPPGQPVTGVITAKFDPGSGVVPFPSNLLFTGTTDLTLNPPVADPNDYGDPVVALSAMDGFSTVAPWSTGFSTSIDPSSVKPGVSVRVFEVSTHPTGAVTGVVAELAPGTEYVATVAGDSTLAILPLKPLKPLTNYMAVLTNGIRDTAGNAASPDTIYYIVKGHDPLVDEQGNSTSGALDNASAQALEPLRQLTNTQEYAAAAMGIDPESIVLSWVARTQSVMPTLSAIRGMTQAGPIQVAPTGVDTSVIGGFGLGDIYIGVLTVPYYLEAPSQENPIAPLNGFMQAAPGGYVAPFDAMGLDPTSTQLTFANPVPVVKSYQTIPVLMTVPNANSGQSMPSNGWPVTIFQHGITRNRGDMLAIADTMASQGHVVIAIDQPLHGITPTDDLAPLLYVENSPFGPVASERTFDVDYISNTTGAPGPDGVVDSSGSHMINLASLLTSRDNGRQAVADLWVLTASIPEIDLGPMSLDASSISFVGQSLGAMVGIGYLSMEPNVNVGVLSVPGGGIAKLLENSPTFGPRIVAGLGAAGVVQGTADFELFMTVFQTVMDAVDPINYAALAAAGNAILMHEVVGGNGVPPDQVIPNAVATAPLSGTEPLIRAMMLAPVTNTTVDQAGLRAVARFTFGDHGSLLSPAASLAATQEMQGQMASMIVTRGTAVQVNNPNVLAGQ